MEAGLVRGGEKMGSRRIRFSIWRDEASGLWSMNVSMKVLWVVPWRRHERAGLATREEAVEAMRQLVELWR